jgi:hypothetical protein
MQKNYDKPLEFDHEDFSQIISELSIKGYLGVGTNGDVLSVIFEDDKKLTSAETKKLDSAVNNYVYKPSLTAVRNMRAPKLEEADWKLNKAIDEEDLELQVKIKEYRKQLRDITLQDRSKLVWPEKPWG